MPGASEPRLVGANPSGLDFRYSRRLSGEGKRSIVVVGNYMFGPITAEPYRAKVHPLRPRRSYFAPMMVEAPGTAPGSAGFITMAIYRHSRIAPTGRNIGILFADEKPLRTAEAVNLSFLRPDDPFLPAQQRIARMMGWQVKLCCAPGRSSSRPIYRGG